ncbi:MAG: M28 family peptidase [Bacteroidota bacterium]|nr:M28 family peptidase [Bacteroidota bacterium]
MNKLIYIGLITISLLSCSSKPKESSATTEKVKTTAPVFSADSAYAYVEKQSLFGPRLPNTQAHVDCGDYIVSQFKRFGATVTEQKADLTRFDKVVLKSRNIIASYNPDKSDRILILTHWDSRPFADNDPNPANYSKPVDGIDDGASGVGVMLELARMMAKKNPAIGVDLLCVDAEDVGAPQYYQGESSEDDWCLGSQYWAKNPHAPGYTARFGILLDMVGASGAVFYKDNVSLNYASGVADRIWKKGQSLGYGQYFRDGQGGSITDDHVYINKLAKIPCVDIINFDPNSRQGFPAHWHTIDDTMKNISNETLKVVGQTLAEIIYEEK